MLLTRQSRDTVQPISLLLSTRPFPHVSAASRECLVDLAPVMELSSCVVCCDPTLNESIEFHG